MVMGFLRRKKKAKTENTEPMPENPMIEPLDNLLFDTFEIRCIDLPVSKIKCETIKDLSKTKIIYCYCYELSHALVFFNPPGWARGNVDPNILLLRISDINSIEVIDEKQIFHYLTIKTAKDTIVIHQLTEQQANAIKEFVDTQKEREALSTKSKKITFTSGGSTKTLTIYPYSPTIQDGEEVIYSATLEEVGYLVTNYRAWENRFFQAGKPKPLTHEEYDEVIATNVERRTESETTTSVNRKQKRSKLGMLSAFSVGPGLLPVVDQIAGRQLSKLKTEETHKSTSSSTETEYGDIVFMKDGKQLMSWIDFPDPHSKVKLINSAKAHFSTTPTTPSSSGGEDPIKTLKLRFAKGEITKEEFLEMKSMLE